MAKPAPTLDTPFRRGERVLTTRSIAGRPEGDVGKVKVTNGLDSGWNRYWVRFADGRIIRQIGDAKPHQGRRELRRVCACVRLLLPPPCLAAPASVLHLRRHCKEPVQAMTVVVVHLVHLAGRVGRR